MSDAQGMKKALLPGLLVTIWSVSAIAGRITVNAPFVSGDIVQLANRQESGHGELSGDQLQQMFLWLKQHRAGWQGLMTEETNEPIELSMKLKRRQGGATGLVVVQRRDGSHYLRLYGPGKWAYQTFGGLVKYRVAIRPLSADELVALEKIVGAT